MFPRRTHSIHPLEHRSGVRRAAPATKAVFRDQTVAAAAVDEKVNSDPYSTNILKS